MLLKLLLNFGDATLVSTNAIIDEEENLEVDNNDEVGENEDEEENRLNNKEAGKEVEQIVETSTFIDDTYFTSSKLERENMYSQMLESYQQIYNNSEVNAEQKNTAISEIAKINKTKNAIMIAENLLSAKGFANLVIFVNDNSVSIIVGEPELKEEQIAQIQNIVSRELNADAGAINISIK